MFLFITRRKVSTDLVNNFIFIILLSIEDEVNAVNEDQNEALIDDIQKKEIEEK